MSSVPDTDKHFTFDTQYQRYKQLNFHHPTRQWVFRQWMPFGWQPPITRDRTDSGISRTSPGVSHEDFWDSPHRTSGIHNSFSPRVLGGQLSGTHHGPNTINYEVVDKSYCIRPSSFFVEGRVFSVIMNETAGANATHDITDYNSNTSINQVKYENNYVYTNVRRFVVVRQKREFCYACPIFTYSGKGTTKRGVRPNEHGVAYSWGTSPQLVPGEGGITKPPIAVVMDENVPPLSSAARVYYGIIHPVQYNVKVKDIGYVVRDHVPTLIGNWRAEDENDTQQAPYVTANAEIPIGNFEDGNTTSKGKAKSYDSSQSTVHTATRGAGDNHGKADGGDCSHETGDSPRIQELEDMTANHEALPNVGHSSLDIKTTENLSELKLAKNPPAFFKKGRVFMTMWAEPKGFSGEAFTEMARFTVVKPKSTFSVCLRISTYGGQATTKPSVAARDHAAIVPAGGKYSLHPMGEKIDKPPIVVKVEDPEITIDPMSRINVAKPYTVEHNVKIRNIGRVVGASVGLLDQYFAESLGHTKS